MWAPIVRYWGAISITDNVVIGAGAVVTKDIDQPCTVVGVPANAVSYPKSSIFHSD